MSLAERAARWTDHERLEFLLQVAREFGSTLDEGRIYSLLKDFVSSIMPLDGLLVSSFDLSTETIRCEFAWSNGEVLDVSGFPHLRWSRDGEGMQSKVILTGKAEVFDVAAKVEDAPGRYIEIGEDGEPVAVADEPAAKSAIMAPMVLEGRVTGVVQVMSDSPRVFSQEDLSILESLVLQMTPAWHHSRLYKRAEEAIQAQKATEEELARRVTQRTADLEAAVKELEGFTYSVSHDLRAPLRAISAASMILREDFGDRLPPDAARHLTRQADAAKKMGALIDDLLKLSRIGRQELKPETFDLSAMAKDVALDMGCLERLEVDAGIDAFGDPRLIRFVLMNLLENAIKFSPEGGHVSIGASDDAFYVRDTGIGFDMEYAEKLFRPFERLVRDEEYPGTGIGLANVQRIVQRHGGRVWAESEPGKGSTFWFTLPRA